MNKIVFIFIFLFSLLSYSQDSQSGYYITNNNQRIEGYFKTIDFLDSTNSVEFKTNSEDNFEKLNLDNVQEYGIGNEFKLKKYTFDLDVSNNNQGNLSWDKNPEWKSTTDFLNVIIEGEASLFSYKSIVGTRFFYTLKNNDVPTQFIYKRYRLNQNSISENNMFRQQLFIDINCEGKNVDDFSKISYRKEKFIEYFEKYNTCVNKSYVLYRNLTGKKVKLKYTVFTGVYSMSFAIPGTPFLPDNEVNTNSYSFGGEVALVVPSGKWEIFTKLEVETLKIRNEIQSSALAFRGYSIDTYLFNVDLGARYNYIINNKNKLFLDAAILVSIPNADITAYHKNSMRNETINIYTSSTIGSDFGLGYVYNNKFGIALRYTPKRNIIESSLDYSTEISKLGLSLRYTIN